MFSTQTSSLETFLRLVKNFQAAQIFFFHNQAICLPCPKKKKSITHKQKTLRSGSWKQWKEEVDHFCVKYQPIHISLIYHCHSLLEENYHPAPVILSLSGQIGSAQWALLLFAVMFETDKSGQTSMEKSQSSECLRRKVCVITGQQHLNRLAGLLLLTQNSECVFTEVGAVGCPLSLRREGSSALHHRNPEQQWLQEELASPTAGHNSSSHQIFTREQITFNSVLVPSGTLLDLTGLIRAHNTKSEQGPPRSLSSWQSSDYCMLLFKARNNPNG